MIPDYQTEVCLGKAKWRLDSGNSQKPSLYRNNNLFCRFEVGGTLRGLVGVETGLILLGTRFESKEGLVHTIARIDSSEISAMEDDTVMGLELGDNLESDVKPHFLNGSFLYSKGGNLKVCDTNELLLPFEQDYKSRVFLTTGPGRKDSLRNVLHGGQDFKTGKGVVFLNNTKIYETPGKIEAIGMKGQAPFIVSSDGPIFTSVFEGQTETYKTISSLVKLNEFRRRVSQGAERTIHMNEQ